MKSTQKFSTCSLWLMAVFMAGCAAAPRHAGRVPQGRLSWAGNLPVLHLSGSPYEMGFQHGSMLRGQVRASVMNTVSFIKREASKIPLLGERLAFSRLDRSWKKMRPFVPQRYLEEMRGLSDGSGIPLKTLERIHALPELTSPTCASFAAAGTATRDGRLIHMRNLDWAIQSGVQRYSALIVHRPSQGNAFLNVGWLGFIGVISGISEQGISVAEIGAKTVDLTLKGLPMPFLLRRVLEEVADLESAVRLVRIAPRTGGYQYLFADTKKKQAVALETTRSLCAVFWMDQEPVNPFRLSVPQAIFRADFALDPAVRDLQTACKGNPHRPGLEPPFGSSAFEVRYRGQGLLLLRLHGMIDPEVAMVIARAIAPKSNVQSVVYAYPQLWVANAQREQPAAVGKYLEVDLEELFR